MADLSDLLVVSIEHAVAAPYASVKLADAGARVIKVERPEGDFARRYDSHAKGQSAYFVWLNRGKQSVCLDLKDAGDKAILASMLESADVLIQNLGPGVLDRLGFACEALRAAHPALIICNISGYGMTGPRKSQKAYDLLIQAESGLCAINGTPEGPARVGVSVCDISAGMTAYQAILEAIIGRAKTGEGRVIDVSLYHAMADWMNVPYLQHRYGGFTPGRVGLQHPSISPYGAFTCLDDKTLLFSIQNEREWQALCAIVFGDAEAASRPGFDSNEARVANRAEVDGWCAAQIAKRTRADNIALLDKARIAYGRLSDLDDFMAHPQNNFISVQTDGGEVKLLAPGAQIRGAERAYGKVPSQGADDSDIRAEFSVATS